MISNKQGRVFAVSQLTKSQRGNLRSGYSLFLLPSSMQKALCIQIVRHPKRSNENEGSRSIAFLSSYCCSEIASIVR